MLIQNNVLTDRFEVAGELVRIENKGATLDSLSVTHCRSAYGALLIPSTNNAKQYTWRIKIDSFGTALPRQGVDIGIQDSKLEILDKEFYHHSPSYCFQSTGKAVINGKTELVSAVFEEDDIVSLQLDMKKGTIKYLVNDEDTGIRISGIDQKENLQYRLAVTIRGTATVTLLDLDDDAKLSNDDDIYDKFDRLQKEMANKIKLIESYKSKNDDLTQKLQDLSEQKEEEKQLEDNINHVGITKVLNDLENEFAVFKQEYNEDKLQIMFDKFPNNLINKESTFNNQFKQYTENVDKMIVTSTAFSKYIQDIDGLINKLSKPDPSKYNLWNIAQILIWIQGLENGRFKKHIDKLKYGFEKGEIIGDDLPDLTRNDLSSPPFDIGNFRDRKQLEMHFQSLKKSSSVNNEGVSTAYI